MNPSLPKVLTHRDERGAALVASVLILLVLSVITSGLFWISQSELASGQAYAQSVRALYLAETGIARYFSGTASGSADSIAYTYIADPCADTVAYPTVPEQNACRSAGEDEPETMLQEYQLDGLAPASYSFTRADVSVTSERVMASGGSPVYEVTAQATIQDPRNPALVTSRWVKTFARAGSPFQTASTLLVGTGGVTFDGDNAAHYHFETTAAPGATGSCAADGSVPIINTPSGTFDLPADKWGDCPYTPACQYDWHESGAGVDSTATAGSDIVAALGLDWTELMSDSYYAGLPNVIKFTSSAAFEAYFDPSKEADFLAMENWPISRVTGDPELYLNTSIKGFGLLIIDGPFEMTGGSTVIEWTGLILVGKHFEAFAKNHFHLKGGMVVGLDCTDSDRSKGWCETIIGNDHTEMSYRPCAITRATSAFMAVRRMDDLFREGGPGS